MRMKKVVVSFGKALLSLNVGIILRLLWHRNISDSRNRLRGIYQLSNPFERCDDIVLLLRTYCAGKGIEIGPGHRPYCDPNSTVFVDKVAVPVGDLKVEKIEDAWVLPFPDQRFDFLFSSHCLEHCPDTIRTLLEWRRVVRTGGYLVLILPHVSRTFDRGRVITDLAHHINDYETHADLADQTHWDEFESISVRAADHYWLDFPESYLPDGHLNRRWLAEHGLIHYHVWTTHEMLDLLKYIGCRVLFSKDKLGQRSDSFAAVAQVV
jgi:SAM-dependent methyltransferase